MLLHNNAERIDPRGVYSDNVQINFFAFNRKTNVFNIYFENKQNRSNFSLEYDYDAIGFIQNNNDKNYDEKNSLILGNRYNSFLWKIFNQNLMKVSEYLMIDIYFQLGKDFEKLDVEFNLFNFTKTLESSPHSHEKVVKYHWEGIIQPQQVMVIEAKFPLFFENCGMIGVNIMLVILGSTFIIFLIGMLHMILSTIFFEEY